MDLLAPASIRAAVEGARGVFHLASPVIMQTRDPEAILSSHLANLFHRASKGDPCTVNC
uniref:3-beta hydroxysteroid dehydrogenase/isomerase domain-containing protein n=1 Tax=Arundo donax TaxID=35708 RepID=A0A0A9AZ16_ARUDO